MNPADVKVGMRGTYSGYPATITEVCEWSRTANDVMVVIRLERGTACVTCFDVLPIDETLTVRLNNGLEVAAKMYRGEPSALHYANRKQAYAKVEQLGSDRWYVWHRSGPFYVAKRQTERGVA